jgi:hypothetical protein
MILRAIPAVIVAVKAVVAVAVAEVGRVRAVTRVIMIPFSLALALVREAATRGGGVATLETVTRAIARRETAGVREEVGLVGGAAEETAAAVAGTLATLRARVFLR